MFGASAPDRRYFKDYGGELVEVAEKAIKKLDGQHRITYSTKKKKVWKKWTKCKRQRCKDNKDKENVGVKKKARKKALVVKKVKRVKPILPKDPRNKSK